MEHNIETFCNSIGFRYLKPETPFPRSLSTLGLRTGLGRVGLNLEQLNTVLPRVDEKTGRGLRELSRMPKASSLAIGAVINRIVSSMPKDQAFVNVGTWLGYMLFAGMLGNEDKRCIGVDKFCVREKVDGRGKPVYGPMGRAVNCLIDDATSRGFKRRFEALKSPHHAFYEMDYRDYFRHVHGGTIGFYIYDAQHRYRDQLQGLQLAEPFFEKGTHILIDDTNSEDNRRATFDFMEQSPHDYRLLFDQRTYGNRHPTFWNGVMLFERVS